MKSANARRTTKRNEKFINQMHSENFQTRSHLNHWIALFIAARLVSRLWRPAAVRLSRLQFYDYAVCVEGARLLTARKNFP